MTTHQRVMLRMIGELLELIAYSQPKDWEAKLERMLGVVRAQRKLDAHRATAPELARRREQANHGE